MDHYDVVIVGSGHAGARAVTALRERGFAGSVLLIGEEPIAPRDRPAPAKTYRLGSITIERVHADDDADWAPEQRVDVAPGVAVAALDVRARTVTLGDGRRVGFGRCIVAASGGSASARLGATCRSRS